MKPKTKRRRTRPYIVRFHSRPVIRTEYDQAGKLKEVRLPRPLMGVEIE